MEEEEQLRELERPVSAAGGLFPAINEHRGGQANQLDILDDMGGFSGGSMVMLQPPPAQAQIHRLSLGS